MIDDGLIMDEEVVLSQTVGRHDDDSLIRLYDRICVDVLKVKCSSKYIEETLTLLQNTQCPYKRLANTSYILQ